MKKFIKPVKQATKELPKALVNGAIRGAGVVGAAFVGNTVLAETTPLGAKLGKFKGPLLFLLGTAAEVFLTDDKMKAAAQGVQAYGALSVAGMVIQKDKLGLVGVGETETPAYELTGEQDENPMQGLESYDSSINGPEELFGDGQQAEIVGIEDYF